MNFAYADTNFQTTLDFHSAYKLAKVEANKWNVNAKTYLATSTDSDYNNGQLDNREGYSTWWVDIYFGVDNSTNREAALKFGNKEKIAYTWWSPIESPFD